VATSPADVRRFSRLSRSWRTILAETGLRPSRSVLEVGCGGGMQLLPLAVRGYRCTGIDCSPEVLGRCRAFIASVERWTPGPLPIDLIDGDFLEYETEASFDLVFNFGVVEHFIDEDERRRFVEKTFALCRPGGHVVSVVPNGGHPFRDRMRREGWGGYGVPEIDYTPALLAGECRRAGAAAVVVLPNSLFGYLGMDLTAGTFRRRLHRMLFVGAQLLPRIPSAFTYRHAYTLICIARKAA
jgi:SAM-dependent methyltransferase